MGLAWGDTRIVFLIGPVAIKVPRVKILWCLAAWRQYRSERHPRPASALFRYLLQGVLCNREEALFYAKHEDLPLARVIAIGLAGTVLIQERCLPATDAELRHWLPMRLKMYGVPVHGDLTKANNVCRIERGLCLVDFGSEESRRQFVEVFAAS